MSQSSCLKLLFLSLSSSLPLLTSQMTQAQNLVLNEPYELLFLAASPSGAVATHGTGNLFFEESPQLIESQFASFSNLFLATNETSLGQDNFELEFFLTTGSNNGFIPPGFTIGPNAINQWAVDLGNLFLGGNRGVRLGHRVTYNSALGEWFDDGNSVLMVDYLERLTNNSTPTEILGQFNLVTSVGNDLASIGNGIDTFVLNVNLTVPPIPEGKMTLGILLFGLCGLSSILKKGTLS